MSSRPITVVCVVTIYHRTEPIGCITLPVTDIIPFGLYYSVQMNSNSRIKVQEGVGETHKLCRSPRCGKMQFYSNSLNYVVLALLCTF